MVGRKKIQYQEIQASISMHSEFGHDIVLENIELTCPDCLQKNIRTAGTRPRKNTRVNAYICQDANCAARRALGTPRQFTLQTSGSIRALINAELESMIESMYLDGAKAKNVARFHKVSDAFMSYLRKEVDAVIDRGLHQDALIEAPTDDTAVSIDETFFKIAGENVYAIFVRGYKTRKVLGVNVSTTRAEIDMRKAFDEAQANASNRITAITADALNATRAMVRHLGYPVTLIIHPHDPPYDKAIIERIEYTPETQAITQIGVKTDIFTKPRKREYKYLQSINKLATASGRPRGHPKGTKNRPRNAKKKVVSKKNLVERAFTPFSRMDGKAMLP